MVFTIYISFWIVVATCGSWITNLHKPILTEYRPKKKNHTDDVCQTILIATALTKLFMPAFSKYPININLPGKYHVFSQLAFIILMLFMFRLPLWLTHSLILSLFFPISLSFSLYFAGWVCVCVIWNITSGNFRSEILGRCYCRTSKHFKRWFFMRMQSEKKNGTKNKA